ncbi:hypothetical protein [Lentzea sp. NPDC059081]|uniref:hypothetical protein n=1 Tax=Lentzea sp. NPDC059081 TaxID=3346719 RepID=UPI0036A69E3C
MDEHLAATLTTAVHERVDYLDHLAADEPSRAALAETEITRLTSAWRVLLELHAPDGHGRCPHCSTWRRPRRPCTVWTTAHQHLNCADGSPAHRAGRHASAAGRSTVAVLGAS